MIFAIEKVKELFNLHKLACGKLIINQAISCLY